MQKTIIGVKTVRGMAALWESGGNDGQRGVARLIAKADGSMPVSLFINYTVIRRWLPFTKTFLWQTESREKTRLSPSIE